jgi:hypothetical protein
MEFSNILAGRKTSRRDVIEYISIFTWQHINCVVNIDGMICFIEREIVLLLPKVTEEALT